MSEERRPNEVRDMIKSTAATRQGQTANPALRGVIVHEFEMVVDTRQRKLITCWLFGDPFQPLHQMSMKELQDHQLLALRDWIGSIKMGNDWLPDPRFETELKWVGWAMEAQFNQEQGIIQNTLFDGGIVDTAINELGGEVTMIDPPLFGGSDGDEGVTFNRRSLDAGVKPTSSVIPYSFE